MRPIARSDHCPWGSRTSTQRKGTDGMPPWYQTAVAEASSTVCSPAPYHEATVTLIHAVAALAATRARVGGCFPLCRGRPTWPGRCSGAGAYQAASRQKRVIIVTGSVHERQAASNSRATYVRSATATMARSGCQRRTVRSTWRAQSGSVLCRLPPVRS